MPSATTVGGLVKHLRWAEMGWFKRALAAMPPEDLPPVPWSDAGGVSLRWVYVHMIEETARHAGHADIPREQFDGSTG